MITTILLLLSLLLHVVAFYFIIVLYMKFSLLKDLSDTQRQILEETENSMTSFLIDIKDENEKFIDKLLSSSDRKSNHVLKEQASEKEILPYPGRDQKSKESVKGDFVKNGEELPNHLLGIKKMEDIVEISHNVPTSKPPFEIEAINLFKEGYTVEQIAKKLNKGKTEVELLLKFRQL